ncbi:MAG: hypothetical protein ABJE47_16125 [bacterium]
MNSRSFHSRLVVVAAALAALTGCTQSSRVDAWQANEGGNPDSVSRGMGALVGSPPALLAGCGPHHVLIGYVDAPGDIRPEFGKTADGTPMIIVSAAQQRRNTVGAVLASVYFSVAGKDAADTVTIELVRQSHQTRNVGPDKGQFTFLPNPDTHGPNPPVWVNRSAPPCQRTI